MEFLIFNKNEYELKIISYKKKLDFWTKKVNFKTAQLDNLVLRKKLIFSKLCPHFYFFHETVLNDEVFFTNFLLSIDAAILEKNGNKITNKYDRLQPYCLTDMFLNDDYDLYSQYHCVYD